MHYRTLSRVRIAPCMSLGYHAACMQVIYTVPHPPKASDVAGLRIEVAARYSVPPENVRFLTAGTREELSEDTRLDTLREPFRAWVKESSGRVHEWAFWFTHAGAHEAGESALVHGSASVAKVMADIEEQVRLAYVAPLAAIPGPLVQPSLLATH